MRHRLSSTPSCSWKLWARLFLIAVALLLPWPASGELLSPQRVSDLEPDPEEVIPYRFCPTRGGLIFVTRQPYFGDSPTFRTDGRIESTTAVQFPGEEPSQLSNEGVAACGEERTRALLFMDNSYTGSSDVWSTDGSAEGTIQLLSAFDAGGFHTWGEQAVLANNGPIIFTRSDEVNGTSTNSLWRTDGLPQGTLELLALPASYPSNLYASGDRAYFVATTSSQRMSFWETDGTLQGTREYGPTFDANIDSIVFVHDTGEYRMLLRFPRTGGAATLLALHHSGALDALAEFPLPGALFNPPTADLPGRTYFLEHGSSARLWSTDGSAAGTFVVAELPDNGFDAYALFGFGTGVVFRARDALHGLEPWISDGTAAGTHLLADLCAGPCSFGPIIESTPYGLLMRGDGTLPTGSKAFWLPQGAAAPIELALPCGPEPCGRYAAYVGALDDRVFFFGPSSGPAASALWSLEPTSGSVRQETAFPAYPIDEMLPFAGRYRDSLYFLAEEDGVELEIWRLRLHPPPCADTEETLCLAAPRFSVRVDWRDFAGRTGSGHATPLTADTGYFWFFDDANVELTVKVVDGTAFNGHYWVYYGALSNVEYWITVEDTVTGDSKQYHNPLGQFGSFGDIEALPAESQTLGIPAAASALSPPPVLAGFASPAPGPLARDAFGSSGTCIPSATSLCLLDGRFEVEAAWTDFSGHSGVANVQQLTPDTGYFWFFDEANVEVVAKLVDGSAYNQHFWVYYGALSNVEYTLTVTDTVAGGPPKIYRNALGQFGSFGDIQAFPAP